MRVTASILLVVMFLSGGFASETVNPPASKTDDGWESFPIAKGGDPILLPVQVFGHLCPFLIIAWFLARRLIPHQPRSYAYRQVGLSFAYVFGCGVFFSLLGFVYGLWRGPDADYSSWAWAVQRFDITGTWSFVRVAYIHNVSYLGGAIGLIVALATIRPRREELFGADSK